MKHLILTPLLLLAICMNLQAQQPPPLQDDDYERSVPLWTAFCQAFEQNNFSLLESLHSKDLIRVTGDNSKIREYEEAMQSYRESFERATQNGESRKLELRFTERIYSKKAGSERGIYRMSVLKKDGTSKAYYGKFHVILKAEEGRWKIAVDYDSSENDSISNADFEAGQNLLSGEANNKTPSTE